MNNIQEVAYERDPDVSPDFSLFVTKPFVPSDVSLTNGSDSWAFHKAVLRKISPVFADVFDGDRALTEIKIEDVPRESITIFQKFVYTKPGEKRLLRSQLDECIKVSRTGMEEVNGLYFSGGKSEGCTKYVRSIGGKVFEIRRIKNWKQELKWRLSQTDTSLHVGENFYISDTDTSRVPNTGWSLVYKRFGRLPRPELSYIFLPKGSYPLEVNVIIGLHTILAKYDLNLHAFTDYLEWLYNYHWTSNIDEFSSLIVDAREKGLSNLADIALKTQLTNFDACTAADYPIWFQKAALKDESVRIDYSTIAGVILKQATVDRDAEMLSLVKESISAKSSDFKASVLDIQFRPHKRQKIS